MSRSAKSQPQEEHMNSSPRRRFAIGAAGVALALSLAVGTATASASPRSHGQLLHLAKPGARANANQSSNWFGYNQGTLEQGGLKQFHSITGDWTVPAVSQHTAGQDESSSDWIGIGGGGGDGDLPGGGQTPIPTGTPQE